MAEHTQLFDVDHSIGQLRSGVVFHIWRVINPRATVILQHGFGEYAERYVTLYNGLIQHLNKHDFEVRAMDMWGHGRSPGSPGVTAVGKATPGVTHVEKAVRDHLEMRREASQGTRPVFLVGHSLGGLVTAGSVVADSSCIKGVILLSPALPGPTSAAVQLAAGAVAYFMPSTSLPVRAEPLSGLSRLSEIEKLAEADPLMLKRQVPFLLGATALRTTQNIWAALKEWESPTLVMHGTADRYTDPNASKRLVDGIAATDKTLRLFDDARHEILNDLDRDEALRQVLNWLDEHLR